MNNITHVAFVLDKSSSMSHLSAPLIKVVDNQIKYLAEKSKEWDHEIRVSIYLFGSDVEVLVYDRDVFRLPKIADHYRAYGNTCLVDGIYDAVSDLRKTPEIHANHNFITYVWTDGEENYSDRKAPELTRLINSLPDNYTVAAFVPNANGIVQCKMYGLPSGNISVWDTSSKGVEELGKIMRQSTDALIQNHKAGVKGTKNLFNLDAQAINTASVKTLEILNPKEYTILAVRKEGPIKEFVESWKIDYRQGMAYYQLSKTEKIQAQKAICIREKKTGKVYSGDNARALLGLPDYEVKVQAAQHPTYDIFVQSTSVNRKLVPGTELLIMK